VNRLTGLDIADSDHENIQLFEENMKQKDVAQNEKKKMHRIKLH